MRTLPRFGLATVCGLLLAAGVHIAAILASPHFAEQSAYARIMALPPSGTAQIIARPGTEATWVPLPDPAVAMAVCAYDLSEAPMRVSVKTGPLFMSFSFRSSTGTVFFTVTDRAAVRGELEIVAMTARQHNAALAEDDEDQPTRDMRVVSPSQKGYVTIRVAAPTPSLRSQAEEAAKAVSCKVERDEG